MWPAIIAAIAQMLKARRDAKRSGGNKGSAMMGSAMSSFQNNYGGMSNKGGDKQATGGGMLKTNDYDKYKTDNWFRSA